MKKIILVVIIAMIPTVSFAMLENINQTELPIQSVSSVSYTGDLVESIDLKLNQDVMVEIVDKVNNNYLASLNLKHKKETEVFSIISYFYEGIYNSIIKCNGLENYTDAECVVNNLTDFRDELKNSAKKTYSGLISGANTKDEKINTDFYLINYYYFMSKIYSECNIKDQNQRLDCLANIQFLEVQITTTKWD